MKLKPTTRQHLLRQVLPVVLVAALGIVLAALIVSRSAAVPAGDEHGHEKQAAHGHEGGSAHGEADEHPAEAGKTAGAARAGPHGGRVFVAGNYSLEITLLEAGAGSRFRIDTRLGGKTLDPARSQVAATLQRLGRPPQALAFTPQGEHLLSDAVIDEPHSFALQIEARHAGRLHRFEFEQVEARVSMSDAQLKASGVELATVGPAQISRLLQLQGEVRLNDDRTVHVVPRLGGVVQAVAVSAGQRVQRGQLLAVLSSQALADQRSQALATQQRLALARSEYAREKLLWEGRISAQQDYLQAQHKLREAEIDEQAARQKLASLGVPAAHGAELTRYEIRAPIAGVITAKNISVGTVLKEDAEIFVVADLSTVWVEMTVHAADVNVVRVGQRAEVRASAFDASATAELSYVGALVGEQTRAATARLVLPNPEGVWRPGLPVTVQLTADAVQVPLAITASAVQTLGEREVAFGRYGQQFEARPLELGRSDGRMVEVRAGLLAGERYAARNSHLIKADIGKAGTSHAH